MWTIAIRILTTTLMLSFTLCATACGQKTISQKRNLSRNSVPISTVKEKNSNNETPVDCKSPSRYDQLRIFSTKSALSDADLAVRKKDYRFFAVDGYGRSMPGTDSYVNSGGKVYGYRVINGTSDAVCDSEHAQLVRNASKYARIYNLEIIRILKLSMDK